MILILAITHLIIILAKTKNFSDVGCHSVKANWLLNKAILASSLAK